MKKNIQIYISIIIFLCITFLSISLNSINAQETKFTVDSILINNEEINIKDGCNLELKYNDVIRIAGRNTPKSKTTLLFANQEYTTIVDDNDNWIILISVPDIDGGRYKITNNNNTICEVTLKDNDKKQQIENNQQNNKNSNTIFILLSSIFILSLVVYITVLKKSKKK
jgi:hypothetical protein